MLKRDITYKDLDDEEVTETFYFNLTKTEILDMEVESGNGGLEEWYRRIVKTQDRQALVDEFKKIILKSYGERSPDGKRFIKTDENGQPLSTAFAQTMAYDQLFFEMATDEQVAADFLLGILPAEVRAEAERLGKLNPASTTTVELPQPPAPEQESRGTTITRPPTISNRPEGFGEPGF